MQRLFVILFVYTVIWALPGSAQNLLSHYLAANNALAQSDFQTADIRFQQALAIDESAAEILSNAVLPALIVDDFDRAVDYARRLDRQDLQSEIAELILLTEAVNREDFDAASSLLEEAEASFPPILHGLLSGWVALGQGSINKALSSLDRMEEPLAAEIFGQFHKALVLASVGDFEGADKILTGDERGNLRLTTGSILAHVQILSELGERDRALLLHDSLRQALAPEIWNQQRRQILASVLPYDKISTAKEGVAETFLSLATVLESHQADYLNLALAKLSSILIEQNELTLFAAEQFVGLGQFELALREYDKIKPGDFEFLDSEFGRADALVDAGQNQAAIEVLRGLERDLPNDPRLSIAIGDIYRMDNLCIDALKAYARAEEVIDRFRADHWFIYHAKGICNFELDRWDEAEASFRRALELSPNRASVLNYLGYSLVERNEKLDEAQDMIRLAADLRPDSGAIADSLGWVYYRLGKFKEAVAPMEKAIALLPTDPVINDHLGDVYWKVGREREAEFQWRRALSFEPLEKDAARIRDKLERGLDIILQEEQAFAGAQ